MYIDSILDLLRDDMAPDLAWRRVLEVCDAEQPSSLWRSLPRVDIATDAAAVRRWLESSFQGVGGPLGLYLGLDTLNMRDGSGKNLELGWRCGCDTTDDGIDWVFERLERGSETLIAGLAGLHREYSQSRWEAEFSVADYALFLGYSGLVLTQALRLLARPEAVLAAWGFHDGDLFALCRTGDGACEMICR